MLVIKKICILVVFTSMFLNQVNAQQTKEEILKLYQTIPDYRIGDQVPDFGDLKVINHTQPTIKLSNYKDGLVILDFWGTGCSTCIDDMPRMDALQKQFGTKVKILPVTAYQTKEEIQSFWKNNRLLKELNLPSVVEDKVLTDYFKYKPFGLHVWIYKGKVIGLTWAEYVDAYNINQVLAGKIPNWPVWNDFYQFDLQQPLLKVDQSHIDTTSAVIRYAQVSGYKEFNGVAVQPGTIPYLFGIIRDSKKKLIRTYFVNEPIHKTYLSNWIKAGGDFNKLIMPTIKVNANAIIWEVADRSKYIYEQKTGIYYGDWLQKNAICYESVKEDNGQTDQQIYKSINEDLNNLLGLNVRWEKRKEKVLILIKTGDLDRFKSKKNLTADANGNAAQRYLIKGTLYQFRDSPLPVITEYMNQQESNPYVFDETKYEGMVDMDLNIPSWTDIDAVRKAIAPYGLALKEEERLVDKFMFSEVLSNKK